MTKQRKQLILAVTAHDIEHGVRGSCFSCPIALSLQRRYPGAFIEVDYEDIIVAGHRKGYVTGKIEQWMTRFDDGKPVKPTMFFLDCAV